MSRWLNLPFSLHSSNNKLISTTTSEVLTATSSEALNDDESFRELPNLLMNLGDFIRQELTENNQSLCVYRNLSNHKASISLICELGCCSNGCCPIEEFSQRSAMDYTWPLFLLIIFVCCVVASAFIMLALYCHNLRRDRSSKYGGESRIYGSTNGSDENSVRSGRLDYTGGGTTSYAQSQVSPQIYHCNTSMEHQTLPQSYPTTTTFKSYF